jgi:hypothetical protein
MDAVTSAVTPNGDTVSAASVEASSHTDVPEAAEDKVDHDEDDDTKEGMQVDVTPGNAEAPSTELSSEGATAAIPAPTRPALTKRPSAAPDTAHDSDDDLSLADRVKRASVARQAPDELQAPAQHALASARAPAPVAEPISGAGENTLNEGAEEESAVPSGVASGTAKLVAAPAVEGGAPSLEEDNAEEAVMKAGPELPVDLDWLMQVGLSMPEGRSQEAAASQGPEGKEVLAEVAGAAGAEATADMAEETRAADAEAKVSEEAKAAAAPQEGQAIVGRQGVAQHLPAPGAAPGAAPAAMSDAELMAVNSAASSVAPSVVPSVTPMEAAAADETRDSLDTDEMAEEEGLTKLNAVPAKERYDNEVPEMDDNENDVFEEADDDTAHLNRLLAFGPPGDFHVPNAAEPYMESKKAFWRSQAVHKGLVDSEEQVEPELVEAANTEKLEKRRLMLHEKKHFEKVLAWRNLAAELDKAREFRYIAKGRGSYFEFRRSGQPGPITKLSVTDARSWFEYDDLKVLFKWEGWVPINEDMFDQLRAYQEPENIYHYEVSRKSNGYTLKVPVQWVQRHIQPELHKRSLRLLGQKVSTVGAATTSRMASCIAPARVIASAYTCLGAKRDPSNALHDAGRPGTLHSQELGPDILYRQGMKEYCAFYGLASALHYSGRTDEAKVLALAASDTSNGDMVWACANKCRELFRKAKMDVVKMDLTPSCSPLEFHPDCFYNIQFEDDTGFIRHCCAIFQNWIFDSNKRKAVHLCKEGLDSCCKEGAHFVQVLNGYCLFRPLRDEPR